MRDTEGRYCTYDFGGDFVELGQAITFAQAVDHVKQLHSLLYLIRLSQHIHYIELLLSLSHLALASSYH